MVPFAYMTGADWMRDQTADPGASVTGVNFYQAFAIARMAGVVVAGKPGLFRLPFGVELELAALAGTKGRLNGLVGIPLAKVSGVLRVLVTASAATRAERIAAEQDLDEKQAKKQVEESDKERERYFERIYELDRELPTHYDLVINTDALTTEQAAQIINVAAKA